MSDVDKLKERFDALDNWDEGKAEKEKKVCCHDCRNYCFGCDDYVGRFHKPCEDFEWW